MIGLDMIQVCVLVFAGGIAFGYLWMRVDAFYRAIDATILELAAKLFPGSRRRIALGHLRSRIRRSLPDQALFIARQHGLEAECVAAAAELDSPAEAGRYAKKLGRAADADRWFSEAFERARLKGDEGAMISIAVEGGLHHRAATYYEKTGGGPGLKHAGEHFEKAGEFRDAARCFEAAGEPYRAFDVLSRAGLKDDVAALAARTNCGTTRAAAKGWLGKV